MKIRYAKLALDRILEIAEFRFPDDDERARAWMADVIDHAAQLETFPRMGQRVPSSPGAHPPMRRLLFKDVWIVYEVREAHSEEVKTMCSC